MHVCIFHLKLGKRGFHIPIRIIHAYIVSPHRKMCMWVQVLFIAQLHSMSVYDVK